MKVPYEQCYLTEAFSWFELSWPLRSSRTGVVESISVEIIVNAKQLRAFT